MKLQFACLVLVALFIDSGFAASALHAETLATHSRHARSAQMDRGVPGRGMSMAQVRRRFGAPIEVLSKAGGDTRRHPTINRWRYADYTVYFERNRVIHSVRDGNAVPPRA